MKATSLVILTLLIYLCLCSFSGYVLSATTVPEHILNEDMERVPVSRSNPSFIQQIMTRGLLFLKNALEYKTLLIIISIAMVYTLYENDDTSSSLKSSKTRRKGTQRKSHLNQRQENFTGSFVSSSIPKAKNQSDVGEERTTTTQQHQTIGNKRLEAQQQQIPSSVSDGERKKKSCSSQDDGPLKPKLSNGMKSTPEDEREEIDASRNKFIREDELGNKEWIPIMDRGKQLYVYDPIPNPPDQRETRSITDEIILSNSFIPHPSNNALWMNSDFHRIPEVMALSQTSKYAYIQFKKKLSAIISKKRANLYKLFPAYKTCGMTIGLRLLVMYNMKKRKTLPNYYTSYVPVYFESFYKELLEGSNEDEFVSYESFREVAFRNCKNQVEMTVRHFLARKFLAKRIWSLEDLKSSKEAMKKELEQIMVEYAQSPEYSLIPENQKKLDETSYEIVLSKMKARRVPFCDCPNISRLLISSKKAPLLLFLFWDIFDALKLIIVYYVPTWNTSIPSLKDRSSVRFLIPDIIRVYTNQDEKYLSNLYFELVNFIEQDYFKNSERYNKKKLKSRLQRQTAFDDYILKVQVQVETFLAEKVFGGLSVAIRV